MCHPVLFGFIFGVFLAKMLRRWAFYRNGGGGCCGGHWARRRAAWRYGGFGPFGGHGGHWARAGAGPAAATGRPLEELVRGLDLSTRQQQEATPILGLAREHLGGSGPRLEGALAAVAGERFDRARAEEALADSPPEVRRELLDGLEHLHNILIPEQREHLRAQLSGNTPPPAGTQV